MKQKLNNVNIKLWGITLLLCLTSVLIIWARSELINADTAWHITLGEWILKNKTVPTTDIFSQSTVIDGNTSTFLSHQWLTDIIFSVIHKIGKMNLLYIVMVVTIFLGHLMVIKHNKENSRLTAAIILLLYSIIGFHKELWITPDTIAAIYMLGINLFIVNWIKSSDRDLKFIKTLIINSIATVILGNIHGGMLSANLIVQAITICSYIIFIKDNSTKIRIKQAIILIASTFVCGLINPHGIKIYGYGFMNSSTAAEYLADWETYRFDSSIQIVVVGLMVLLAIIGIVIQYQKEQDKSKIRIDIMLFCMYAAMLFRYQRTLNIFTLAFALYLSKYVYLSFKEIISTIKFKRFDLVKKISTILAIIIALVVDLSILTNKPVENKTIQECAYDYISLEMVDYIKTDNGQIKIFNTIECGGYLICLGIAPYIDGRTDPYLSEYGNQDLFTKSIKAVHSIEYLEGLTREEGINCLILRKNAISSQIIYASDKWEVKYESKAAVMFVRTKD